MALSTALLEKVSATTSNPLADGRIRISESDVFFLSFAIVFSKTLKSVFKLLLMKSGTVDNNEVQTFRSFLLASGRDQEIWIESEIRAVAEHHRCFRGSIEGPGRLRRRAD